jgi:four helix bundle protein
MRCVLENPLLEKSLQFAVESVSLYKVLIKNNEYVMSKQFLKSSTSIGANVTEANYAISRAEFVAKMQIALKEAAETMYWLTLLTRTGYVKADCQLYEQCNEIKKILTSTIKTAKSNKE